MIWQQSWIILDHKPKVKWWIQKRASQVPQEGPQPQGLPQKRINLSVSVVCSVHGLHWILRVQSFHSWIDGSQWFSSPGLPSPCSPPRNPLRPLTKVRKGCRVLAAKACWQRPPTKSEISNLVIHHLLLGGISTHFVKLSLILDLSRLFLSSFACIQKLCHYATDEIGGKYESSGCWFSRRWINDEFQIGKMLRSDQFNQWCPRTFWSTDSPCR